MKDLIGLETAVSDFIEEKGRRLCNYKKMVQLSQVLHQIIDLAKVKPQIRPKQDLVNMLRVCDIIVHRLSLRVYGQLPGWLSKE